MQYPWNNFLHTQVEQSIRLVFENAKRPASSECESSEPSASSSHPTEATMLAVSLINESRLIDKLLKAYYHYCDLVAPRPAFMGHLVKIIDTVNSASEIVEVKECLDQLDSDTKELLNKFIIDVLEPTKSRIATPLIADVIVTDLSDSDKQEAEKVITTTTVCTSTSSTSSTFTRTPLPLDILEVTLIQCDK